MKETKSDRVFNRLFIFMFNALMVTIFVKMVCALFEIPMEGNGSAILGVIVYLNMFVSWVVIKISEIHEKIVNYDEDEEKADEPTL